MARHCRRIGPALALLLAGASAQAQPAVHVEVTGGGCPNAQLIEQKLAPLLGESAELAVGGEAGDDEAVVRASVEDLGAEYSVEVDGREREVEDPARDCVERARVASVFIALNARASRPAPEPEEEDEEEEDEEEDEDDDEEESPPPPELGLRLGVRVLGEASYATEIERGAFGAGAGAWLGLDAFHLALVVGALSTAEIELPARNGVAGSVELTRFPFNASASYLLRAGPLSLGPALGVGFDLLHLRGAGVERPQTELRLNPGGLVAADLHLALASGLSLFMRFALNAFPRAYDLSVDPEGRFAGTPRLWLSGDLGLDIRMY
jgi:hypothetical protein